MQEEEYQEWLKSPHMDTLLKTLKEEADEYREVVFRNMPYEGREGQIGTAVGFSRAISKIEEVIPSGSETRD